MDNLDKTLNSIFNWGGGVGGLLFMTFVVSPPILVLAMGFTWLMVQGMCLVGLT